MQPLELSLEREGKVLDLSKALFRTNPGDASLLPLEGPVPAGESAILFVADQTGEVALATTWFDHKYQPCPVGVVPALVADFATGTRFDASFHLKANVPASVVTMYPWGGAASYVPSATLLFPPATWGKEHVIVNAWESATTGVPSAQIVASEDGTEVTLDPTEDVQGGLAVKGTAARVPTTYHLDKGEFLQLVQSRELTGSVVVSNKPTTVFGGHSCMMVPSSKAACEVANQQLPPFEQWGHEYVGVGYRPRVGNEHETMYYRIVAARDGTVLDYDPAPPPGAPIAMSARQAVTFTSGVGDAFVVRTQDAEHAIYLAAYMANGQDVGGYGDPEFVNVVPAGQYLSSYSFYADPTYAETSLVVVRAKAAKARGANFEDVWLECAGDLTGWKPIGTRGDYEFMRVDLARGHGAGDRFGDKVCQNGLQRMRSTGPFTATLWGWDKYASYAYPGGMAQRKLVTTPLVSVQ
ncbi:MAG: IgGFc-binding protein [Myxococcales bacterium]|nr:IgGFc-binding protein [Myxococcales bacterium]